MVTVRGIEALSDGKLKDPVQPGLSIEATPKGKTWRYYRRVSGSGRLVRQTLGIWPSYSVTDARRWAAELNRQVEAGIDPKAVCRASKAAMMTIGEAHSLYMLDIVKGLRKPLKPRTLADKLSIWKRDVEPRIGQRCLMEVTSATLWDLVEAKGAVAPIRANRLAAELKVFFGWCLSRAALRHGIECTVDPSESLNGKHFLESKGRTRTLSDCELGWLLRALADERRLPASTSYRRAFLLMLLTGARIGEVRRAPTSEYSDGVWTISAARTR